jgi:hypothetical protein
MARATHSRRSASGEIAGMLPAGITVMVDVAVLLAGFGSLVVAAAVTEAVFVTGPGDEGSVTVNVNVAEAPLVSVPALQVMVVVPLHAPPGVDERNVVPGGRTSVTVTAVAALGPPFVTTIVYVSGSPVP